MIDTMTIGKDLSKSRYDNLYIIYKEASESKGQRLRPDRNSPGRFVTTFLSEKGFLEIVFLRKKLEKGFISQKMIIKLKPKLLIDPTNYSDVSYYYEIQSIRKAFNEEIRKLSYDLPDFLDWNCIRVDYAITIWSEFVPEYIKLMKMGDVGEVFRKSADDFYFSEGSVYLKSESDDIRINFYNKLHELTSNAHSRGSLDNYIKATNKLRLEVQCNNQKLLNIKKKYGLDSKTVKDIWRLDICRDTITDYFKMIAGTQDYYKLGKAEKIMMKNEQSLAYRPDELLYILCFIAKSGSVWKALKSFEKGKNAFEKRIRDLRKLGINPTLIPDEWKSKKMPNLFQTIQEYFDRIETGRVKIVE
ncbi:hypothetical protein [Anaerosolibacter sp.]|uniref:hypothetical protein n=1 Tax=Anaerosolibacter sp. TaxID=1872527 RepID=UPI0039EEF37D